jgi:molecular chaperone GrpE (heat shock protein)
MMEQNNIIRPVVTVGAFLTNRDGKIFLMRSKKWDDKLVIPGGKIDYMEKMEDALKREVKEETNLEIEGIEFLGQLEFIDPPNFSGSMRHFIGLDFKAKVLNEDEVKVDGREGQEYLWLDPEEIVKRDDVEESCMETVKKHFIKTKKGLFNKGCKDCEKYKTESEEYKAGWQRALADYKNLQNETAARRSEWVQMSEIQILEDFIPVYENFKLAFRLQTSGFSAEQQKWADGIGYIMKQFESVLKSHGVEEVKTVGEKFDPKFHEAIKEEEQEGVESHIILKEIEGGYKTKDKVIKVAKVIVNK